MKHLVFSAVMLASTMAHAGWSDGPGNHTYDGTSAGSSAIVALVVCAFAVYGFYKFATRND
jgi:amino acid transporter